MEEERYFTWLPALIWIMGFFTTIYLVNLMSASAATASRAWYLLQLLTSGECAHAALVQSRS